MELDGEYDHMAYGKDSFGHQTGLMAKYKSIPFAGCLGSSPDPGCEFPAFFSPTNTGERSMCSL